MNPAQIMTMLGTVRAISNARVGGARKRGPRSMGRYPFRALLKGYEREMEHFLSPSAFVVYRRYLRRQARIFEALARNRRIATSNPGKLTTGDMIEFLGVLRDDGLKDSSIEKELAVLNGFLRWLGQSPIDELKHMHRGTLPRAGRPSPRHLSEEERDAIFGAAGRVPGWRGEAVRFVLRMYDGTGLRPGELRKADIEDLDTSGWTIWVRHPKGERTYGRNRTVLIKPDVREHVLRFLEARREHMKAHDLFEAGPLIPRIQNGKAQYYSDKTFRKWKKDVQELSGISFRLKDFRSTFGQDLIDRGARLDAVSQQMGHSTTKTTETYYARVREAAAMCEIQRAWDDASLISPKRPLAPKTP